MKLEGGMREAGGGMRRNERPAQPRHKAFGFHSPHRGRNAYVDGRLVRIPLKAHVIHDYCPLADGELDIRVG